MVANQLLALIILATASVAPAFADEGPGTAQGTPGFYGGVELRDRGVDTAGVDFGRFASTWGRYTAPVTDDRGMRRSLVFGGYRFTSDLAVEGSFSTADRSRGLAADSAASARGVGLALPGVTGELARSWNADVYTAWSFLRRFSVYGRLGYAQAESAPSYALATALPADARLRDGVNYGLGLRYDVTSALGLRLEYARFPHFVGEGVSGPLPESDQVQLGVQFRF